MKRNADKILLIDTSQPEQAQFVLAKKGHIFEYSFITPPGKRDVVLRELKKFLLSKNTRVSILSSLIVVVGPGPFTAVRIGVTIGNMLSRALQIPLYGVTVGQKKSLKKIFRDATENSKQSYTALRPVYSRPPNITHPVPKKAVK
ncbi:MAG: hypothetical protein Q8Q20_00870 [bacterium]|nr:hypothetical protein [bacterium]